MTDLYDAAGKAVVEGDLLLADNGTTWRVLGDTDPLLTKLLYTRAQEVRKRRGELYEHGEATYVPTYLWLTVTADQVTPTRLDNRKLFDRLYQETGAAAKGRAKAQARHQQTADHKVTARVL